MSETQARTFATSPNGRLPNPVIHFAASLLRNTGKPATILETEDNPAGRTVVHMLRNAEFPDVGLDQTYAALKPGVFMLSTSKPGEEHTRRWLRLGPTESLIESIEEWLAEIPSDYQKHLAREGLRFNFLHLALKD